MNRLAAPLVRDPETSEAGMRNNNRLYPIIGALFAVIAVGGFFFQERHTSGIDVAVGGKGISVETHWAHWGQGAAGLGRI